ncbi:MAG: NAD(P)-dependent alcohol dehydrogenase [Bdellovibrionales bacterium]
MKPLRFERRNVLANDVQIDILFCGVCHSDLHFVSGEWGEVRYPVVPGHEIVGRVERVGAQVTRFRPGDFVGVGCLVNSCRECSSCKDGLEQYCEKGATMTYGSVDPKDNSLTQGGYSTNIVVDQDFVVRIPEGIDLERAAPLLCAGITTYSPLRHWKVKDGDRVAVAGLGGLGHMAVKLAAAMGADVTVLSTSESKREDAMKLGAHSFAVVKNADHMARLTGSFDLVLNTISAPHDYNFYLNLLKRDGTMVLLGLPDPQVVAPFSLVPKRRSLAGSLIGGISETQEMLNFCAQHKLAADVEVIPMDQINAAYERLLHADVKYRFVINMRSLK